MVLKTTKHQLEKKSPPWSNFQPWTSCLKRGNDLKGNTASSTGIHAANFKGLHKAPAHLDGSWQTGQEGLQKLGFGLRAWAPLLTEHSRHLSLSAVPFSELHTSSYTTRGQMYFRWSHGHLSTVPGGYHVSITKNVTRGQRGILRTKSGLCFHLLEPPSFLYGAPEASKSEEMKLSQNHKSRGHPYSSSNYPTRSSLCHPHRMSDRAEVQDGLV